MTISNYCSDDFHKLLIQLVPDVLKRNRIIEAVDAEIESDRDSSCSECDLRRRYGQ